MKSSGLPTGNIPKVSSYTCPAKEGQELVCDPKDKWHWLAPAAQPQPPFPAGRLLQNLRCREWRDRMPSLALPAQPRWLVSKG